MARKNRVVDDIVPTGVGVNRYRGWTRLNHWITAASLILLALSGFALFHASLYWLTGLFGGGQTTRWIHPFIGVVLVASFLLLFLQLVKYNIMRREDLVWARHLRRSKSTSRCSPKMTTPRLPLPKSLRAARVSLSTTSPVRISGKILPLLCNSPPAWIHRSLLRMPQKRRTAHLLLLSSKRPSKSRHAGRLVVA